MGSSPALDESRPSVPISTIEQTFPASKADCRAESIRRMFASNPTYAFLLNQPGRSQAQRDQVQRFTQEWNETWSKLSK